MLRSRRPAVIRPILSAGVLLALGTLLTAASLTDAHDVPVVFDGSANSFDLQVAASADPAWTPSAADWEQGRDTAAELVIDSAAAEGFAPGDALDFRIAVKNASPTVDAAMTLIIDDPDPRRSEKNPDGGFAELFDQLTFTVSDSTGAVIDHVPGNDLAALTNTWTAVAPGEARLLDVSVHLPASTDNRWSSAATQIRFQWRGESE